MYYKENWLRRQMLGTTQKKKINDSDEKIYNKYFK